MGEQVIHIVIVGEPLPWGDNDLVWIGIEPRPPPAERAVGDNVVSAQTHQMHFVVALFALIVVDILTRHVHFQIVFHPSDIVREDEEIWASNPIGNMLKAAR